jgi:hypothetical protein
MTETEDFWDRAALIGTAIDSVRIAQTLCEHCAQRAIGDSICEISDCAHCLGRRLDIVRCSVVKTTTSDSATEEST